MKSASAKSNTQTTSFDVAVIGSGPGGYVAAIRASQLGLNVAIVEKDSLGGICLNWGCIPTKAMLRSAEIYHLMQRAKDFGLAADNITYDLKEVVKRSRGVAKQLTQGVAHLLKKNKITVIMGEASIPEAGKIDVQTNKGTTSYTAKDIIIATGARARELPGLESDHNLVWTYKDALQPNTMPKRLLVIGSGAIGIEFASFFNTLGSKTTVVEVMDRILPVEDAEISTFAQKQFEKQGMEIHTKTQVKKLERKENTVVCHLEKDGKISKIEVDRVISAVGIVGNTENIGLEKLGVRIERAHVVIDKYGRTGIDGIWAIGDVAGAPWLAHKASHEGVMVADLIAGNKPHPIEVTSIPGCTYCHPQVASVGLTEAQAKEQGYNINIGRFPFMGNGKAIALGEPEGLVKTIFDNKTGELLGAHMIGTEVTEMIQGYTIGKKLETTEQDLIETVFPHPTLSEMMHESVLNAYGKAIHY